MKTSLQLALAKIAPHIAINTIWEHDDDHRDIRKDCDGFDDENPDDWQCWQSEVCATAIVNGEKISGSGYLGGTWEKAGDVPEVSNPEISGYENQMTQEALKELQEQCPEDSELVAQINAALAHCQCESAASYAAQLATA